MSSSDERGLYGLLRRHTPISVAGISLLLSIYTAAASHNKDRLSTLPKLSFSFSDPNDPVVGLWVENSGSGPAVIKTFDVVEGDLTKSTPAVRLLNSAVTSCETVDGLCGKIHARQFTATYFMKEGAREPLLRIDQRDIKNPGVVMDFIYNRYVVRIEYCSVYDYCWVECSKSRGDTTCGTGRSPATEIFEQSFWDRLF